MKKPVVAIIVKRKLESLQTGANVYLSIFISKLIESGFKVKIVFAPKSSFGNIPVSMIGNYFFKEAEDIIWPKTIRFGRFYISVSFMVYIKLLKRIFEEIYSRVFSRSASVRVGTVSEPLVGHEANFTARVIEELKPNLAIAEYSALGPILGEVTGLGIKKGIFLHDLFSLRAQAMRDKNRPVDFADLTIEEEAALCKPADLLIYASQSERDVFRPLLPERQHLWLAPQRDFGAEIPPSGHAKALFMGVRHSGNLDAVEFLMEEIWPQVIEQAPAAELWIVGEIGHHLRPEWVKMPGVKILGFVEDLTTLGGADTIGLAPTRVASGISIKFVDYMNLGMAILASGIAIEGYGDPLGRVINTADNAEDFAARLAQLLNDSSQRHALAHQIRNDGLRLLGNEEVRKALGELVEDYRHAAQSPT